MFRLIKIIFNAFIIVLAFIGFNAIGGEKYIEPIKTAVTNFIQEYKDNITNQMGDFSNIDKEYQIEKAVNLAGYNAVMAEHKASGQKMILVNSGKKPILTEEDINSNKAEAKIKQLSKKINYHGVSVTDVKVTAKGNMNAYGKKIPYARFEAHVTKLPMSEIGGIVAGIKTSDGTDKVLISLNENKKYSQLITNEFFKNVNEKLVSETKDKK